MVGVASSDTLLPKKPMEPPGATRPGGSRAKTLGRHECMSLVQEMISRWTVQGVLARPGASENEIVAFEARYSVTLPADFREYLRLANGTERFDDEFLSFAPIQDIKPVAETWGDAGAGQDHYSGCFAFADWAIHCWDYAIQLDGSLPHLGAVFRVEDSRHRSDPIASSFSEWVSIYLRDPDGLHPGRRP